MLAWLEGKSNPTLTTYTENALVVKSELKRLKSIQAEVKSKKQTLDKVAIAKAEAMAAEAASGYMHLWPISYKLS